MSGNVLCLVFGDAGYDRGAQGIVGTGQRLCAATGGKLHVLVLGKMDDAGTSALKAEAEALHLADDFDADRFQPEQALSIAAELGKSLSPAAVLLGNDAYSQEIAPRLAYRLGGAAVGDASEVTLAGEVFQVRRSVYGGKAVATIAVKRSPAVIWLRARAMPVGERRAATAQVATVAAAGAGRTRLIERQSETQEGVRLEDARVIVSGGRGLGGPEPFEELRKLAKAMNAEMAASRAACDSGWVPPTWQVGQTGKKVAPDLYLAVAISGASQHLLGISDARVIAAINTDADAPIFKHCQFGIVEDYRKVIGTLSELLAKKKG